MILHPSGRRVVTGSENQTVLVWDLNTGECLGTLQGEWVSFDANGRQWVTLRLR